MATLVLFGRPASGKGTLAQRLSEANFRACSTGQAMREWAAGPSPEQQALRATMAAGGYGSDELAVRIVREFITNLPGDVSGVILDGFPRDLRQLDAWLAAPVDHGIGVLVDTPADVCRDRVFSRLVCGTCGWTDRVPATICAAAVPRSIGVPMMGTSPSSSVAWQTTRAASFRSSRRGPRRLYLSSDWTGRRTSNLMATRLLTDVTRLGE